MLDYKILYIILIIDMLRMIIPALLRTHKRIRSIILYLILNKHYNATEQTTLIVFIVFKGLTKMFRKALCKHTFCKYEEPSGN